MNQRRVRIVATLGPAADRPGIVEGLIKAGLDVARINLSHGSPDEHRARVQRLHETANKVGREIAILADLPGPKLRVILNSARPLVENQRVIFSSHPDENEFGVTESECLESVRVGHRILLDDGRIQLRAESASAGRVEAIVSVGGTLQPRKGINLPDSSLNIPALTPRDYEALATAASIGADALALSFVRQPEAADDLRRAAKELGLLVPVIAKIERPEAVKVISRIVATFDGIMVARGDLGVELPLEQVPVVQKHLIAEARAQGRPVITATDMLDSMRTNPRPTRAEASDVANAIYDGTDAIMLSGETAVGDYPVEAISCMDRIARQAESDLAARRPPVMPLDSSLENDLAVAACHLAEIAEATAIVVPTLSGRTARHVAGNRPKAAIIAPVPTAESRRRLSFVWGVTAVPLDVGLKPGADRIDAAVRAAFAAGAVNVNDRVVVLAGHPIEGGQRWPTIRLVRIGEAGTSLEP